MNLEKRWIQIILITFVSLAIGVLIFLAQLDIRKFEKTQSTAQETFISDITTSSRTTSSIITTDINKKKIKEPFTANKNTIFLALVFLILIFLYTGIILFKNQWNLTKRFSGNDEPYEIIGSRNDITNRQSLPNLSHEFRIPMNEIIGLSKILLETHLTKNQYDYVMRILNSAHTLSLFIDNTLYLSKFTCNKLESEAVNFDIDAIIEEIVQRWSIKADEKGLEIATLVNSDLPLKVQGDPGKVTLVISNLLDNAIRHTEQGKVVLTAQFDNETDTHVTLHIKLSDTGSSISKKEDEGSTGNSLGLAVAEKLIKLMGGEIGIESPGGKESFLWFTIPLEKQGTPIKKVQLLDSIIHAQEGQQPIQSIQPPRRILVTEDNIINQKVTVNILERAGYLCDTADNGIEALNALSKKTYDMIFMDCQMPEMDGFEAAKEIRQQEKETTHTPIIALTANTREADKDKCLEVGMDDYIVKPLNKENLLAMTKKWIKSPEKSPLDISELLLRVDGNRRLINELLDALMIEYPQQLLELSKGIDTGNFERVDHYAHKLKGTVSTLSAKKAHELAFKLEMMGKEKNLDSAHEVFIELENELKKIEVWKKSLVHTGFR
ncbi:MAG: response regulator [bacterium]